ncbi:MAG: thiamine pyrophosphate-dependent enzyme, partial [Candidatus Bathyarchaeia archaeon]
KGHSRFDPATYRPKEEVEEWLRKDPVTRFRAKLLEMKTLTEEEADKIEQAVIAAVEKATKFATESPYPAPEEALEDVYG